MSSPLSEAMLHAYGQLTLIHSKYRYEIAALEAASDCRRVRDLRNVSSLQRPGASQMKKKRSNRNSDDIRHQSRKRGGSSSKVYTESSDGVNQGVTEQENGSGVKDTASDTSTEITKSELCELVEAVRAAENDGGRPLPPDLCGNSPAQRVWAHLHRIKTEKAR